MIPTKKDIAFVEYGDETSSGVAKDALHNYKLDGEHKIKANCFRSVSFVIGPLTVFATDHLCAQVEFRL